MQGMPVHAVCDDEGLVPRAVLLSIDQVAQAQGPGGSWTPSPDLSVHVLRQRQQTPITFA